MNKILTNLLFIFQLFVLLKCDHQIKIEWRYKSDIREMKFFWEDPTPGVLILVTKTDGHTECKFSHILEGQFGSTDRERIFIEYRLKKKYVGFKINEIMMSLQSKTPKIFRIETK